MSKFTHKIIKRLGFFVALVVIGAAALVSMGHLLTPYLNEHLPDFETWSAQSLQTPVKIEHVGIHWNYIEPEIEFDHVTLLDKSTKQPKFVIQKITANLSVWRSLINWKLLLESLTVSGAHLNLQQQKPGHFRLEEFNFLIVTDQITGSTTGLNDVLGWIFSQPQLELENIDINYSAQNTSRLLTLKRLTLNNSGNDHRLTGKLVVHQDVPTRAQIDLTWTGSITDLNHVSAKLYLYLKEFSLSQWLSQYPLQNIQFKKGMGNAKIWVTWNQNQLQKIQTQLQFYDVEIESLLTHKIQQLTRLSGNVTWNREGDNIVLSGDGISLDFPDHLWPTTQFTIKTKTAADGSSLLESIYLDYLDLHDAKEIALNSGYLPESMQTMLTTLNPQGEVRRVNLQLLASPLISLSNISLSGEFAHLNVHSWNNYPTIANIKGTLNWNGKEGELNLNGTKSAINLHSVFANPLQFDQINGLILWKKTPDGAWTLNVNNFQAQNADMTARAEMTLNIPVKEPATINLMGNFSMAHAEHVSDYLPLQIFNPKLVHWLQDAFLSGQVENGKAILQGRLVDFPFDKNKGTFVIGGTVKNLDLFYADDWPIIRHANGELTFSSNHMSVDLSDAQIFDMPLKQIHAEIPYMGHREPSVLHVQGTVQADAAQGLEFIDESPLKKTLGEDLSGIKLSGPMQLKLGLIIPLEKTNDTKVQGDMTLANMKLTLPAWNLILDNINGALQFTQNDIIAPNLQAQILSAPATLSLATQHPSSKPTYLKANLSSVLNANALQTWLNRPVTNYFQGSTPYTAELHLVSHQESEPTQIMLKTDLKGMVIKLPQPFAKNAEEIRNLQINITAGLDKPLQTTILYDKLVSANLSFPSSKKDQYVVNGDIKSPIVQLNGEIKVASDYSAIEGNFKQLYIASGNSQQNFDPQSLPILSINANDVKYGDKSLGSIVLKTLPTLSGLQIKDLQINSAFSTLRAAGFWDKRKKGDLTRLKGQFSTSNLSQFLSQWGMSTSSLVAGNAGAYFNLSWHGAPYNPIFGDLSGNLSLSMDKGRIVNLSESTEAKIGIGRMLSLLSLQSIPRRLSGDFSDLFTNGYSFDSMKGDFKLENGQAYTSNTRFDGPVASIDIAGRIGLQTKDYDLKLGVTTYVASSLLPAAIAWVYPPAGIATWLVSSLVSRAASQSASYQYQITGSWDSPQWEQLSNGPFMPRGIPRMR